MTDTSGAAIVVGNC